MSAAPAEPGEQPAPGPTDASHGPAATLPRQAADLRHIHALRQVVVACLSLALGAAIALALWREVRDDAIEILPIDVPTRLAEAGFTPQVVARRLADQIDRAARAAREEQERRRTTELAGDAPDLAVPIAGLSLQGLTSLIRAALGLSHTRVSGEVVQAGDRISVRLRVSGHGLVADTAAFEPENFEGMLAAAAPEIWRAVQPGIYAWHLARSLHDQEEIRRRLGALRKARTTTRDAAGTIDYLVGRSLLHEGDAAAALLLFERLTRDRPDYAAGWTGLAAARLQAGRPGEALAAQRQAVALHPGGTHDRGLLAEIILHSGQPEAALAEAREALRHDRYAFLARHVEGEAMLRLRRAEEALGIAIAYRLERPDLADTHHAVGQALQAMARDEEALGPFGLAAGMRDRSWVGRPLSLLGAARSLMALGRPEEALQNLEHALADTPETGAERFLLLKEQAAVLLALGRKDAALVSVRAACRLPASDAEAWLHLAGLLERMGHDVAAQAARARAEALRQAVPPGAPPAPSPPC